MTSSRTRSRVVGPARDLVDPRRDLVDASRDRADTAETMRTPAETLRTPAETMSTLAETLSTPEIAYLHAPARHGSRANAPLRALARLPDRARDHDPRACEPRVSVRRVSAGVRGVSVSVDKVSVSVRRVLRQRLTGLRQRPHGLGLRSQRRKTSDIGALSRKTSMKRGQQRRGQPLWRRKSRSSRSAWC